MTAVLGPFVFTSDVFRDAHITKSKQAGCRSIALQLGVAPPDAAGKARAAGLQVIWWGTASPSFPPTGDAVWMPQAENTSEFEQLIFCLNRGIGSGFPIEPVMTSGGMETEKPNATPAEIIAERARRHHLLESFGVTTVWPEVYLQDAHRPGGNAILGSVDGMIDHFKQAYGFKEAHPVIGLWTVSQTWGQNPYSVSKYDLSKHGRNFGAWRAEQMDDPRYAEIKAVPDVVVPPPPPPPPPPPVSPVTQNRLMALALLDDSVDFWRSSGVTEDAIALQRQTLAWRALNVAQSAAKLKAIKAALDQAGAPTP